jgi:nitroreductase
MLLSRSRQIRRPGLVKGWLRETLSSVQKTKTIFDAVTPPRDGYHRIARAARQKMTEEEANHLLSLTSLSLSAFNVNDCRFVVVRDPDLRKQINKFSLNHFQIPQPAFLIILCADLTRRESNSGAEASNGCTDKAAAPGRSHASRLDRLDLQRDEVMCACGIAAQTLMLTAKALGYDSWRLEAFDTEGIGRLINLPPDHLVAMLMVVGKNIKSSWNHTAAEKLHDIVVLDQF